MEALLAEMNVTRAAEALHITQSALSARLQRLRKIFGDPLFLPTSRGVVPTAMAVDLQEPLRAALDQVRAVVSGSQEFTAATARHTFCILASDYVQITTLLPLVLQMANEAPSVRLMIRQFQDTEKIYADLERGRVDVAFVLSEGASRPNFHRERVLCERYVGISRRGEFKNGTVSLQQFVEAKHIIVSPRGSGFRGPADDALSAMGLKRQVAFAVSSFAFQIEAVSTSNLIALAPERMARRYKDQIDIFEPPVTVDGFSIEMLWHSRAKSHPAGEWLRARLSAFCKNR